jgi:hypothetical protein
MVKHIVKEWRSDTKIYTCVCGHQSTENIKPHSLKEVTCLDCLRLTVKRQSDEIETLKTMGRRIANFQAVKEDTK